MFDTHMRCGGELWCYIRGCNRNSLHTTISGPIRNVITNIIYLMTFWGEKYFVSDFFVFFCVMNKYHLALSHMGNLPKSSMCSIWYIVIHIIICRHLSLKISTMKFMSYNFWFLHCSKKYTKQPFLIAFHDKR